MLPDQWQVVVKIVICIYLQQLNLFWIPERILLAILYRDGGISLSVYDQGRGCWGYEFHVAKSVSLETIPEG